MLDDIPPPRAPVPALIPALIPSGAAYFPTDGGGGTRDIAFLLVPGFTLLAFSSAVEPLRIANQLSQRPLYRWRVLSEGGGPVTSSAGIEVGSDPLPARLPRQTHLHVCAGVATAQAMAPGPVAAVQRHARHGGAVGGICTGAFTLARAGLLTGRAFTLHWENQPGFAETFPDLMPTQHLFEASGAVTTCGGGAAATDMMLAMIRQDHGEGLAAMVSEMCLRRVMIGQDPTQRSATSVLIQSRNAGLLAIAELMRANLEHPLTLEALARRAGYSRRHIERLFLSVLDVSPGRYYRSLRLDHGRMLLSTTDMSLHDVALATGFNTLGHFSRAFRDRFGMPPSAFNISASRNRPR